MIAMVAVFVVLLLAGMPIAFALGLAGMVGLLWMQVDLVVLAARAFTGIDNFALLAVPFFILSGEIMGRGGITERLVRTAALITGQIRAGTAYAAIVSAVFFSGISGAALADAAALGQVFIRGMPKEGYRVEYSAALVAAGSMIGPIVPPSILMVIYASVTQMSIIRLFVGGIVPGLVMALALAFVVMLQARGGRLPKATVVIRRTEVPRILGEGALVLVLPGIIVGGIVLGIFTPTEAGGVAAFYAAAISTLVFRTIGWRELWHCLAATARITASLYLIIATASIVSYVLTLGGIGEMVRQLAGAFAGHPTEFLLCAVVAMLLVGIFLEPGACIVLFMPLLFPPSVALGVDPVQFSIVAILTITLGMIHPPVGLCLFVCCKIGDVSIFDVTREIIPFFAVLLAVVILLIAFPAISTALPRLLL
ncbi:MAG: TRAP transporter large permease [Alphaproteobacteria bacterium]|nr:TRAP transporter large permease [Alphaproteobacteria bacterium]MBV9862456.1 TRAP transporter large permease [Alphaproteobacteria bacterium]